MTPPPAPVLANQISDVKSANRGIHQVARKMSSRPRLQWKGPSTEGSFSLVVYLSLFYYAGSLFDFCTILVRDCPQPSAGVRAAHCPEVQCCEAGKKKRPAYCFSVDGLSRCTTVTGCWVVGWLHPFTPISHPKFCGNLFPHSNGLTEQARVWYRREESFPSANCL